MVRALRIPGLLDVTVVAAPDGGLATPDRPDRSLTGAELADIVRRGGGEGLDVRLLAIASAQNRPTVAAMALELRCDVLVAPEGSELREVPGLQPKPAAPGATAGDRAEMNTDVLPVDVGTGYPVDWIVVQPSGQETTSQAWFELFGGLVLERAGIVTLQLPGGGLALATRADFVQRRSAAAALLPGHSAIVTVAVGVHRGDFVVSDYSGRISLCDGLRLAATLSPLPLFGTDLRLWVEWPAAAGERDRLRDNLTQLAAITGATVWAPMVGSRVEILDGCQDLGVLDSDGRPGRWKAYGRSRLLQSDVDGRLVPAGGVVTASYPGVPLISVLPAQEQDLSARYSAFRPSRNLFRADLAVLADGRIAFRYLDGSLLAAGARQLRELLEQCGWRGSDLVLLCSIPPERAAGARSHADTLAQFLDCAIRFGETSTVRPETRSEWTAFEPNAVESQQASTESALELIVPRTAQTSAADEGTEPSYPAGAVGRALSMLDPGDPAQAECLIAIAEAVADHLAIGRAFQDANGEERSQLVEIRAQNATRLSALTQPWEPAGHTRHGTGVMADLDGDQGDAVASPIEDDDGQGGLGPPDRSSRIFDGPRLTTAAPSVVWHGLTWLPELPHVNEDECELFVACTTDPEFADSVGIPSANLFLLAHLDAARLGERTRDGSLLQLRVGPGGAIDVEASNVEPPPHLLAALRQPDVYVLPAGWLDRCRLVGLRVVRDGRVEQRKRSPLTPVNLLSRGAAHGVSGLPNEVERWPRGRGVRFTARYVLVEENGGGLGPWVRLQKPRPPAVAGYRLLRVLVGREQAIDVAATSMALNGLTSIRSSMAELLAAGAELILPVASYPHVRIKSEYRLSRGAWRRVRTSDHLTLATVKPNSLGPGDLHSDDD